MPQVSGDFIRLYPKVKMFGAKMSGLMEELLKMSGQQKKKCHFLDFKNLCSSFSPVGEILPQCIAPGRWPRPADGSHAGQRHPAHGQVLRQRREGGVSARAEAAAAREHPAGLQPHSHAGRALHRGEALHTTAVGVLLWRAERGNSALWRRPPSPAVSSRLRPPVPPSPDRTWSV